MPHYDYRCAACGHETEVFQAISAEPLRKCLECGKAKFERLLGTGGGLLFKGSGFYLTDYRDGQSSPATANQHKSKGGSPKRAKKAETEAGPQSGENSSSQE